MGHCGMGRPIVARLPKDAQGRSDICQQDASATQAEGTLAFIDPFSRSRWVAEAIAQGLVARVGSPAPDFAEVGHGEGRTGVSTRIRRARRWSSVGHTCPFGASVTLLQPHPRADGG